MLNIEKIAKNIKLSEEKINNFTSRYTLEPLYRGYGNTIGNALRRILLSSILGSAIKAVKIETVLNEFSTMEGVKESVADIILNIKEIVVELDEPGEKKMRLSVKGPKVVTAADIVPETGVTVINPDQVIATVTTDRELEMEFLVDTGEGFVVSDEIETEHLPLGYLAVDAIYTPIRKVTYNVEDTMVGRVTNYDKLTLEVQTDGSVDIREAISYAVELLTMHIKPFMNIGNALSNLREEEEIVEEEEKEDSTLSISIEELNLGSRAYNALKKANKHTLGDIVKMNFQELTKIQNVGKKTIEEIQEALEKLGHDNLGM